MNKIIFLLIILFALNANAISYFEANQYLHKEVVLQTYAGFCSEPTIGVITSIHINKNYEDNYCVFFTQDKCIYQLKLDDIMWIRGV